MLLDGVVDKLREGLRAKLQPEKTNTATPPVLEKVEGGVVSSDGGSPPTVTLLLGLSTVYLIRFYDHYTPTPGDTVICLKYGTDITILGTLAT